MSPLDFEEILDEEAGRLPYNFAVPIWIAFAILGWSPVFLFF